MRLFQEGDEEAFRELVRRYKEPITSFVMRMLNDHDRALDVAQETFVNVFTHAGGYKPMASFTGWLYRIAYNLAINEIRRQRRQPVVSLDAASDPEAPGGPRIEARDEGPGIEEDLLGRERREAVRRCVASLPAKYRGAIVMKDMEGMTFDQIAGILGCPESTVKSRVMRGRRMIRSRLESYLRMADGTPAPGARVRAARR
ncbi:MAG TPA: sigma-70 family RNA polymerase sigma factor [Candidatus Polarisedimenticolia bacterium]|nr:sigma-70 family RNA polymerase sigma factor [Candidatus Polarisedimenticolia bacterium]